MNHWWFNRFLVEYGFSILSTPFILLSKKKPASTLAWLWAVFLFPYLGPLAYVLLGSEQMYRKRLRRRHDRRRQRSDRSIDHGMPKLPPSDSELSALLSKINISPAGRFDEATLLFNAQQFYPALEKSITCARKFIYVEFYIWRNDSYGERLLKLLTEAARKGVRVHVIVDEVGSYFLSSSYFASLVASGGKFSWFNALNPLRNRWAFSLRNHRKLQIIDGETAFVGGMNLGREYMGEDPTFGEWRDVQIQLKGPVAQTLSQTFHDDWLFATGESTVESIEQPIMEMDLRNPAHVIEEGPDSTKHPLILSTQAMFNVARRRVWITTGYFFPQEPLLSSLKLCAARGVDVRLLVGAKNPHPYIILGARCYYEELLSYGVKIFEYSNGTHHAKVMLVDDAWFSVGSANLDVRSMNLNFELNVTIYSQQCARLLEEYLARDFEASEQINLETFNSRSKWTRLSENLCRLTGPIV